MTRGRSTLRSAKAILLAFAMVHVGCTAATWQGIGEGLAAAQAGSRSVKLMLFGELGHNTYLGCVNCNEYAADSIFNEYGTHGSRFAANSVTNHFSEYGSAYSAYGACNPYATDPPVIVDRNGAFYGRLTLNQYHAQRTRNEHLLAWLAAVCAD